MLDKILLSGMSLLMFTAEGLPGEPDLAKREHGKVDFKPLAPESPEPFRLAAHSFDFTLTPRTNLPLSGYSVAEDTARQLLSAAEEPRPH